jgi:hypothetical protein
MNDDRLYIISQHIHDTVKALKEGITSRDEDELHSFYLEVDWHSGEQTDDGRKPRVFVWIDNGERQEFPIYAESCRPHLSWKHYFEGLKREFRIFARNALLDFRERSTDE